MRFSSPIVVCVVNSIRQDNFLGCWNWFIRLLPPREALPPEAGGTGSSFLPLGRKLTPSRKLPRQIPRPYCPPSVYNSLSLSTLTRRMGPAHNSQLPRLHNKPN